MEQLQEEVPEVKEEEEEEAVMVASGGSDPTGGPDSSLPSSSYTGEWSHSNSSCGASRHPQPQAVCLAARAEDLFLDGVQLVLISALCEIMLQVMERLISSSEVTAQPLAMGFGVAIKRTGR